MESNFPFMYNFWISYFFQYYPYMILESIDNEKVRVGGLFGEVFDAVKEFLNIKLVPTSWKNTLKFTSTQ